MKETKIFLENVALFAGQEILPVDFSGYFGQMIERLQSVQEQSDDCFDFSPCIEAVKKIQEKTTALYRQLSGEARNRLVKLVGGTMNWLMQTLWVSLWTGFGLCVWDVSPFDSRGRLLSEKYGSSWIPLFTD